MKIDPNDPRLTAYALGEMPEAERAAFERELAGDRAACAEIEAIRALGDRVGDELRGEPAPALTTAQRDAIARAPRRGVPLVWKLVPLAACLALAVGTVYLATRPARVVPEEVRAQSAFEREAQVPKRELQAGVLRESVSGAPVEPSAPAADPGEGAVAATPRFHAPGPEKAPAPGRAALRVEARRAAEPELDAGGRPFNTEAYDRIRDNPFRRVAEEDTSTFSIDVDTASYGNIRRFLLQQSRRPPADAVRIEEMLNYFSYDYAPPAADAEHPFRAHVEVASCPWNPRHRLARIALKGKTMDAGERPPSNLVFLLDVSGSMNHSNKLPLVQAGLRLLVQNLGERDRVAIVVYAGAAGLVLPSTSERETILTALASLRAGGSTNGGQGIQLAYRVAAENFIEGGVNRVILCTDGDFNVGVTDRGALTRLIEDKAKGGVFLSVLGFGTGNLKDATMEELSNRGNGNYAYVDSIREARKVLVEEMGGTLVTIAKDVKIQIFFNPKRVAGYRLIGYENRMLARQDFNDDTKDAGEIGAGHCVTALYELIPAGQEVPGGPAVDPNPFVPKEGELPPVGDETALFQLRLRYKQPDGDTSRLIEQFVRDGGEAFDGASADFRWAAAVAAFGMDLRDAPHRGELGLEAVMEIAKGAVGEDRGGYRREFVRMVDTARLLPR